MAKFHRGSIQQQLIENTL